MQNYFEQNATAIPRENTVKRNMNVNSVAVITLFIYVNFRLHFLALKSENFLMLLLKCKEFPETMYVCVLHRENKQKKKAENIKLNFLSFNFQFACKKSSWLYSVSAFTHNNTTARRYGVKTF